MGVARIALQPEIDMFTTLLFRFSPHNLIALLCPRFSQLIAAGNMSAADTAKSYFDPAHKGEYFGSYNHNGAAAGGTEGVSCPGGLKSATCTYQTTGAVHQTMVNYGKGVDGTQANLWGPDGNTTH